MSRAVSPRVADPFDEMEQIANELEARVALQQRRPLTPNSRTWLDARVKRATQLVMASAGDAVIALGEVLHVRIHPAKTSLLYPIRAPAPAHANAFAAPSHENSNDSDSKYPIPTDRKSGGHSTERERALEQRLATMQRQIDALMSAKPVATPAPQGDAITVEEKQHKKLIAQYEKEGRVLDGEADKLKAKIAPYAAETVRLESAKRHKRAERASIESSIQRMEREIAQREQSIHHAGSQRTHAQNQYREKIRLKRPSNEAQPFLDTIRMCDDADANNKAQIQVLRLQLPIERENLAKIEGEIAELERQREKNESIMRQMDKSVEGFRSRANEVREKACDAKPITEVDEVGQNGLHRFAFEGKSDLLSKAVREYPHLLESKTKVGETPLMRATAMGHLECVRILVEAGANTQVKSDLGESLLHEAATPEIVVFLAKHIKIDERDPRGSTPLITAAFLGKLELCKTFHRLGADLQAKDNRGRNALEMAAKREARREGCKKVAEFLREVMANPAQKITILQAKIAHLEKEAHGHDKEAKRHARNAMTMKEKLRIPTCHHHSQEEIDAEMRQYEGCLKIKRQMHNEIQGYRAELRQLQAAQSK